MALSAAAQPTPIVAPNSNVPWVDPQTGIPTTTARQFFQQMHRFIVSMNRAIPCECTNVGDVYTLSLLSSAPQVEKYNDFELFTFVAPATSSGSVTGRVSTPSGVLATIKFYKTNGSAQAGAGDVVVNSLYIGVYNDALDGGNGGLVLK